MHQLSKRASQNPFRKNKGLVQRVAFHPSKPFFFVATQNHVRGSLLLGPLSPLPWRCLCSRDCCLLLLFTGAAACCCARACTWEMLAAVDLLWCASACGALWPGDDICQQHTESSCG